MDSPVEQKDTLEGGLLIQKDDGYFVRVSLSA